LQERNTAAIAGAYQFYVDQGKPGSEDALAEYFLNCGDVKLEEAARAWAANIIRKCSSRSTALFGEGQGTQQSSPQK
jgi:hypothetical protein